MGRQQQHHHHHHNIKQQQPILLATPRKVQEASDATPEMTNTKLSISKTTRKISNLQNFILKEIVNALRRTMQTNALGKSIGKTNMTQGIQGTSSNTGSNHHQSVTKREIVGALLELHTNPLYEHWVTLFHPNTMQRIGILRPDISTPMMGDTNKNPTPESVHQPNMDMDHNDIPPQTIVQINHSISYQSIRKHL